MVVRLRSKGFDVHSELSFQLLKESSEFTTRFGIPHGVGTLEAFSGCGNRFLFLAFFGKDLRDLEPGVGLLFVTLQTGVKSLKGFSKSREPSKLDAQGVPTKGVAGIGIYQSTNRRFTGHAIILRTLPPNSIGDRLNLHGRSHVEPCKPGDHEKSCGGSACTTVPEETVP